MWRIQERPISYGLFNGDNNAVEDSLFDNNTARNGSAIYTDGINFVINNTKFNMNQAWSYLLNSSR